jgi:hypothetical protein
MARRKKVGKVDRAGTVGTADNPLPQPADTGVAVDKAAAEDTSDSSQTCRRLPFLLR